MDKDYKSKESVLAITTGFVILFLIFRNWIFIYISTVVGLTGLLSNYLSTRIHIAWMQLSRVLGMISSFIILCFLFFVVIVPVAFIRRIMGRTILLKNNKQELFVDRNKTFAKQDFENTW